MSTDPVFMKVGSEYYWYHNEHLGTPQMMTTSSGAVVWKAKYSSFGKATVESGSTVVNPLRLPGQNEDVETGLHYNLYRYYDPLLGRYNRKDPLSIAGGINFYIYGLGNPLLFRDQYGLMSFACKVKLGLGIIHLLEGSLFSIGGILMPVLAASAIGPAGLLMTPAAIAYFYVGVMELELGHEDIEEVISGKCDDPRKGGHCSIEPYISW